ncbi:hypothetical protein PVL29_015695 [Vitis rotundifolia]|uniref:Clp ATPase C-terminal domain-containing protein n=1 Tax=Vitis rotundifolia TaxID=103349 RepID=A0AA39DK57_VITRO|nr:hypothetical protein PVL29_015695 [Vitis rotundifolia]
MLDIYGTDLTQLAEQNKLDPILCKRRKNNSCLISDPSVGKTMIAEGLEQNIAKSRVLFKLLQKKIDEVNGSEGEIILFIDEAHTLVGVGSGGQALDATNILKPTLAKGELKKYIEKDPALKRRFQPVDVLEPSIEKAIEILKCLSKKCEAHHHVQYSNNALIVYYLPDKAIDLIDDAGARVQLHLPRISLTWKKHRESIIEQNDAVKAISMMRIYMSEYMEKHMVGHHKGGQLTEVVRRRPYNLVLFDEIEKILDDGWLTDSKGRTVDFNDTLIIMTSNIGGSLITQTKIQLGFEQVKNLFLNRLDKVIVFKQLSKPQLRKIVDIRLEEVYKMVKDAKNINVEVAKELKEKLVEEGFRPGYGARPMRRVIVSLLEDNVADMILEGTIVEGDTMSIGI